MFNILVLLYIYYNKFPKGFYRKPEKDLLVHLLQKSHTPDEIYSYLKSSKLPFSYRIIVEK